LFIYIDVLFSNKNIQICLEVSTATELNKVFSGRNPRQVNYTIQRFGDQLNLQLQVHPDDGDGTGIRNAEFYN
jgi:hypothetical protein